jgi:hypothetical protein
VKGIVNNWQVSGVTSIISGAYGSFSYAYANVPTGVLSGTGAINPAGGNGANNAGSRPDIVCDPTLPRGERTFERQFKTECIAPPSDPNRIGNAKNDEYIGPGYVNHDFSLFRNIALPGHRNLQFRAELYNALNSMQVSTVNTTATFDANGKQTNAAFGQVTAARDSRRIQLAARFTF